MSLLFGNENNHDFNHNLTNYLLNTFKKRMQIEWLQVYPTTWNNKLITLLGNNLLKKRGLYDFIGNEDTDKKVVENTRVNFNFNKQKYVPFQKDIENIAFTIVRTDKKLFHQMKGSVVPKAFWKTAEQFEK